MSVSDLAFPLLGIYLDGIIRKMFIYTVFKYIHWLFILTEV